MRPLPTLKQLTYLVALAKTRHFGKAAAACHVTQSTLSAGIRELEAILGAPVAERTQRTVRLTPLGETVAQRGHLILAEAEALVALGAAAQEPLSGPLVLGVIPTIAPFLLPPLMAPLRKAYPRLKLYLREDQTDRLLSALREGALDLALIALPYVTDGLQTRVIGQDPFFVALPRGHPMAQRRRIQASELEPESLLLLEDGHCLRDHALAACHLAGRETGKAFAATSLPTLVAMVAAGLGITLLPRMAITAGSLRGQDVVAVPLDSDVSHRDIGFVWRKHSVRESDFSRLASFFQDGLSEMGKEKISLGPR